MQCLLLSSKNTHWISLNDSNTGLLPWQQAKKTLDFSTRPKWFSAELYAEVVTIDHICINSLVSSVLKINIGNQGNQVNYWGG